MLLDFSIVNIVGGKKATVAKPNTTPLLLLLLLLPPPPLLYTSYKATQSGYHNRVDPPRGNNSRSRSQKLICVMDGVLILVV